MALQICWITLVVTIGFYFVFQRLTGILDELRKMNEREDAI